MGPHVYLHINVQKPVPQLLIKSSNTRKVRFHKSHPLLKVCVGPLNKGNMCMPSISELIICFSQESV